MMEIKKIIELLDAKVVGCQEIENTKVEYGFSSDLMSDVLTLREDNILLITGLSNIQSIRTAELSDIKAIVLVRNKKPNDAMIQMAKESNIALILCNYSMFKTSGLLFENGLSPIY